MLKKLFLCISLHFIALQSFCIPKKPLLQFKISRPYSVINFLEASTGAMGTSDALKEYIKSNTAGDTAYSKLIRRYQLIELSIIYQRTGFPESRPSYRSTKDLLMIQAIQSNSINEFKQSAAGILHNTDFLNLIDIMVEADQFYQKLIWSKYSQAALHQLSMLKKHEGSANDAFIKLKKFYNSAWGNDMPFIVTMVPVPGHSGGTSATPHANSLCIDVLTDETKYAERVGITMHEIAHVLYAEQSREVQSQLESCFSRNSSVNSQPTHHFIDEGLATACGNGWMYHMLTHKIDSEGWYDNEYIEGLGRAIYPMVSQYILQGKSIDQSFIDEAIRLFGEKFPKASMEYGIQINHLTLYADEERPIERQQISQDLRSQFMVSWLNFSSPILGPESLNFLKNNEGTQLIIIDRHPEPTLQALRSTLPDLNTINYNLNENFIINYFDSSHRLIIIAKTNEGESSLLFKALKEKRYVTTGETYWKWK